MKRITVSLDDETHRLAKLKAAEKGTSLSAMVRDYLTSLTEAEPEADDPAATGAEKPEQTLDGVIEAIFARGEGLDSRDNLTREEMYDRDAFRRYHTNVSDSQRPMAMVISAENAKKVEALFRKHLERNFQGKLKFDPIVVEPTFDQFDRDTFHVTVVYDGDYSLLDPGKLNSISSALLDEYEALGIRTTVIESYVGKAEWDIRDELFLDTWEELNAP